VLFRSQRGADKGEEKGCICLKESREPPERGGQAVFENVRGQSQREDNGKELRHAFRQVPAGADRTGRTDREPKRRNTENGTGNDRRGEVD